ncbi:MAG: hypothetical protein JJ920_01475 [Roseitalea sp.]|nr:hypothetical protein [Roseitalea sp.]MBO6722664.1 hypothetical protein [Roseitalea sp.]MBO6741552.1 hypothetical protein [Roseitalea sp.]
MPTIKAPLESQRLSPGSGFEFRLPAECLGEDDWLLDFMVMPTLVRDDGHVLAAVSAGGETCRLTIFPDQIRLEMHGQPPVSGGVGLEVGRWSQVKLRARRSKRQVVASVSDAVDVTMAWCPEGDVTITLGRHPRGTGGRGANARIEAPRVALVAGDDPSIRRPLCAFDFAAAFASTDLVASFGEPIDGRFINHPTRRVLGRGRTDVLQADPDSDARLHCAIHVHEYDLTDAEWDETGRLRVPDGIESGVYAVQATSGTERLRLPFVVRPTPGKEKRCLLLLPTYTYLAYANERLAFSERGAALTSETGGAALSEMDKALDAAPELGASLYDRHADGSGVHYSSRRRPILNFSPDYRAWWCTRAPRHFLADLNIAQWLDHFSFEYDVATDEDLHREGEGLLDLYDVLMTGTHPEYTTARMLSALHRFADNGHILYLGANGFYWVTGADPQDTGVIESRRGFAGTRNWNSDPLEVRLSTTGEPGGLWRHRGLAPNRLTGLGFGAVGFTKGSGYKRTDASYEPAFAWIFDGIEDAVIGDFGDIVGGAAGDELDRMDPALGTPDGTVLLASSSHDRTFLPAIEDEIEIQHELGGDNNPNVRADMVYLERPGGGRLFGTGSINWCGSLAHNGFDNSVSRVTHNVLTAFLGGRR